MALDPHDKLERVTQDDCQKMYPGFTVTCQACGSTRVAVRNTLGSSPESGSWGNVTLECAECEANVEVV